jgi:hypothetical protein
MANTTTYNGWSNYETWAVKLWIDNEPGPYEYWSERAKEILRDPRVSEYLTTDQTARQDLAEELKNGHEEDAPQMGNTVFADLLNAALSEVEWYEIAESMLAEAKESMLADGETLDDESEEA